MSFKFRVIKKILMVACKEIGDKVLFIKLRL